MASTKKSRPERAPSSPIAFRPCSNGEYCPAPQTERDRRAARTFLRIVEDEHRRHGMTRREFSQSSCGMAAALLALNQVYDCGGDGSARPAGAGGTGGYAVDAGMLEDPEQACEALGGDEFIFDVQVHPPSPLTPWTDRHSPMDAETFVKAVFVDSDTRVACLTGVPAARNLGADSALANRQLSEFVEEFAGPRLLYHVNVDPTLGASELEYMAAMAEAYKVAAGKVYPQAGPWRLDEDLRCLPDRASAGARSHADRRSSRAG